MKADDKQFAELAKAATGPSSRGGDLNYFGRGRMVPAFDKAVFSAKKVRLLATSKDSVRLSYYSCY